MTSSLTYWRTHFYKKYVCKSVDEVHICEHLRNDVHPSQNVFMIFDDESEENQKQLINFQACINKVMDFSTSLSETGKNIFLFFLFSFLFPLECLSVIHWEIKLHLLELIEKSSKAHHKNISKEYITWAHFNFCLMKNIFQKLQFDKKFSYILFTKLTR